MEAIAREIDILLRSDQAPRLQAVMDVYKARLNEENPAGDLARSFAGQAQESLFREQERRAATRDFYRRDTSAGL